MENKYNIILNENKSKHSVNEDEKINLELNVDETHFSPDNIVSKLDEYEQYMKEKDESYKYRFIFTINPICSNVLFNIVSEIVQNEGSDNCKFFGKDGEEINPNTYTSIVKIGGTNFNRDELIRNTGLSHPSFGNLEYHPGYDIFNNHILRQKEFTFVNRISTEDLSNNSSIIRLKNVNFNTIMDYARDSKGSSDIEIYSNSSSGTTSHLYSYDTILTYEESIENNLSEENGWFGFSNKTMMEIPNVFETEDINYIVNKVLNNKNGREFIDMYPDRTLYSFTPKYNKYRNRPEYNWDICLTYPYKNEYNNEIVSESNINGIECVYDGNILNLDIDNSDNSQLLTFRSKIRHGLLMNDFVRLTFMVYDESDNVIKTYTSTVDSEVRGLGKNNNDVLHYFTISMTNILNEIRKIKDILSNNNNYRYNIRMQRVVDGRPCKYYIRIFKRIPNFKGSDVYEDAYISDEEINKFCNVPFNLTLNKLGFGLNSYNDQISQALFNDDIMLNGLRDNLGRELSEVFLTIVKTNKGREKWYVNKQYGSKEVEYSHCFGKVTSGIDMAPQKIFNENNYFSEDAENNITFDNRKFDLNKYNIHCLNNVSYSDLTEDMQNLLTNKFPKNVEAFEDDITINGVMNNGEFYGDIVELSEMSLTERILEDIYHRFNTYQREFVSDEFKTINYDEITSSDWDKEGFKCTSYSFTSEQKDINVNIAPDGYYYKPHYSIQIKEFSSIVETGMHTIVHFDEYEFVGGKTYTAKTDKVYYLNIGDKLYFYNKKGGKRIEAVIVAVNQLVDITFTVNINEDDNLLNYNIYKPNTEMSSFAYDLDDGSGTFVYREIVPSIDITSDSELYDSVFTNGAHYFHRNITFFLRRQDPNGDYYLNYNTDDYEKLIRLKIKPVYKDVSNFEYIVINGGSLC